MRRFRRGCVALCLAVLALPWVTTIGAATAMPDRVAIEGRGSGHGDGLSQYGALGYAVNFGWTWEQILAHYYGGTSRSVVSSETLVRVRLTAFDGAAGLSFVDPSGELVTSADGGVGRYHAVAVRRVAVGTFEVWGRTSTPGCAPPSTASAAEFVANGFSLMNPGIAAPSTADALVVGPVPSPATLNASANQLVAVCLTDGSLKSYRGAFSIITDTSNVNHVVNIVPVDSYLRGVLPLEVIPSWAGSGGGTGMHALRAQAVAARTYGLVERRNSYANTCDTANCQVYGGAGRRQSLGASFQPIEDSRTDAAIVETAGVVLRTVAGELAFTQFNASSGGHTSGRNFPAVADLGDKVAGNANHVWATTVPRAAIESAYPTIGTLQSIDVTSRNGLGDWGGRALTIRVRGAQASIVVTGEQFRGTFGLRSSWLRFPSSCEGPGDTGAALTTNGGLFNPVEPVRLVDTRIDVGGSRLADGCVLEVPIRGVAGVPDNAVGVAINLTTVNTGGTGFFTAYPCGVARPLASNLNSQPGPPVANLAVVALGARGSVCIFASSNSDLVVDLLGWFGPTGSGFVGSAPQRIVDTRIGLGAALRPTTVNGEVVVSLPPSIGSPAAVALNITSTRTQSAGFVTVYPCGQSRPNTSNLNTVVNRDIANQVSVAVSAHRTVCVFTQQPTDVVVDLLGAFGSGSVFVPQVPQRIIDTRSTGRQVLAAGVLRVDVPLGHAVAVNLTATGSTTPGYITAYPCAMSRPLASNLNLAPQRNVANVVMLAVSGDDLCLYSSETTHVVVDLLGVFPERA